MYLFLFDWFYKKCWNKAVWRDHTRNLVHITLYFRWCVKAKSQKSNEKKKTMAEMRENKVIFAKNCFFFFVTVFSDIFTGILDRQLFEDYNERNSLAKSVFEPINGTIKPADCKSIFNSSKVKKNHRSSFFSKKAMIPYTSPSVPHYLPLFLSRKV